METINPRDIIAVVKASATNRLGVPLLRLWAALVIGSALIIVGSIAWMYLG